MSDQTFQYGSAPAGGLSSLLRSSSYGTLSRSERAIQSARRSLRATHKIFDLNGIARFIADTPVPIIPAEEIDVGRRLGSGWTMTVHEGKWHTPSDLIPVAVKQLNLDIVIGLTSEEEHSHDFRVKMASVLLGNITLSGVFACPQAAEEETEIRLMSHELLRTHKNIVRLLGLTWTEQIHDLQKPPIPTPTLVVERAATTENSPLTLGRWIEGCPPFTVTLESKLRLLEGVASGLQALHALGVIHGDIKPDNVLIFEQEAGLVAKISDFGFCISGDDELQAARGGTPLWNAPECMGESQEKSSNLRPPGARDIYSYGLLIWYVLFEELPFGGSLPLAKERKQLETLKPDIDIAFAKRYRPSQEGEYQEEFEASSQKWVSTATTSQHVLRFLMQWTLVRQATLRQTWDLFGNVFRDKNFHDKALKAFITPGCWDDEWLEFGHPSNRLGNHATEESLENWRSSTYHCYLSVALRDWGDLRDFESTQKTRKLHEPKIRHVPFQLQQSMLEEALAIVDQSPSDEIRGHERFIADCYAIGFGVEPDLSKAASWYERSAAHGDDEAVQNYLLSVPSEVAFQHLGTDQYCDFLSRALLKSFQSSTLEISTELYQQKVSRLHNLLCENPALAITPLEYAWNVVSQKRDSKISEEEIYVESEDSRGWTNAHSAIMFDDVDRLREVMRDNPHLAHHDGNPPSLVLIAALNNRAGILRVLLQDFGMSPRALDIKGNDVINSAFQLGHTAVVRILLSADNRSRISPDHAGQNANLGQGDTLRFLFESFPEAAKGSIGKKAAQDPYKRTSFTALVISQLTNNWAVFCTLLSVGVDAGMTPLEDTGSAGVWFAAPLVAAATYNPPMLAALLAFGAPADMRVPIPDGRTPMHLVCGRYNPPESGRDCGIPTEFADAWQFNRAALPPGDRHPFQHFCISILASFGADVECKDFSGNTPLMYALENDLDVATAKFLMSLPTPANINAADFGGNTSLHKAVGDSDNRRLLFCLQNGANKELRNVIGRTPLAQAVKEGNLEAARMLLEFGADAATPDTNGHNSISLALQHSRLEMLGILEEALRSKSDKAFSDAMLASDCRGLNSLHICIMMSTTDCRFDLIFGKWLLGIPGLDLDQKNMFGWTMLHMAVWAAGQRCAEILLELGAKVDVKDSIIGWTPLHHACSEGNFDMLNVLLGYRADFRMRDDLMGWTPQVLLEQATDLAALHAGEELGSKKRRRKAIRRRTLHDRVSTFVTEESARRGTKPLKQTQVERETELARSEVFPECRPAEEMSPETQEPLRVWNSRNMKKLFLMDDKGACANSFWLDPSGIRIEVERKSETAASEE